MGGALDNAWRGRKRTDDSYYTDIAAVKVFEEDLLETTMIKLILQYQQLNWGAKNYILSYGNMGAAQFNEFYSFGQYQYVDKLPEATVAAVSIPSDSVATILRNIEGAAVNIMSLDFVVPDDLTWVKWKLQQDYGYNIMFNTVSITIDINTDPLLPPNYQTFTFNYDSHTYNGTTNRYVVKLVTPDKSRTYTINIVPNNPDTMMYVVDYAVPSKSERKFWIYDPATNVYPALNNPAQAMSGFEMYPVVMLRNSLFSLREYDIDSKRIQTGNKWETVYRPSTITKKRYDQTDQFFSSLAMDLETMLDDIEENEDSWKLQDAFLMVGVTPADESNIATQALFETFDYLYALMPPSNFGANYTYTAYFKQGAYNQQLTWIPQTPTTATQVIGPMGTYKRSVIASVDYKDKMLNYFYSTDSESGTINKEWVGTVSSYDSETGTANYSEYYEITRDSLGNPFIEMVDLIREEGEVWGREEHRTIPVVINGKTANVIGHTRVSIKNLSLTKQVTKTTTKNIMMGNIKAVTEITRGAHSGYVELEIDDEDLVIPLAREVVEDMTYMEQCDLFGHSLHLLFYAAERHVVHYYRGGWFQSALQVIVMAIIVVVTVYFSWGTTTAPAVIAANALWSMAVGLALTIALKILMSMNIAPGIKMVLAAIAIVVAMYAGGGGQIDLSQFTTAVQLAQIPTTMIDIYVKAEMNDIARAMEGLSSDFTKFSQQYESTMDSFKDIMGSFNTGVDAGFLVELSKASFDSYVKPSSSYSPSAFYFSAIEGDKQWDLLYQNPVENFIANTMQLGIQDIA